jgi:hypothetical protein
VLECEFGDRFGDTLGLTRIKRARYSCLHIAESAGAGAGVAHDHEGGVALGPALTDIRATGFFANRHEAVGANDRARLTEGFRGRRFDSDPIGLARDRIEGALALLWVALGAQVLAGLVKNDSHGLTYSFSLFESQPKRRMHKLAQLMHCRDPKMGLE